MKQLIIDIGNTRLKAVVFYNRKASSINYFSSISEFKVFISDSKLEETPTIISSVRSKAYTQNICSLFKQVINLNHSTEIPIKNKYATPQTLGNDRLANIIAANKQFPNQNNLVIDVGTCLKFDVINGKNEYLGGSISLGFQMRYNALHNLTDNLPLIEQATTKDLIGTDTFSSISTGVYFGMLSEIKSFIALYEEKYPSLNIFLTGGDLSYFENKELSQKNSIFVDKMLTLKGLKVILDYNEKQN